jgi:hypothetical protein
MAAWPSWRRLTRQPDRSRARPSVEVLVRVRGEHRLAHSPGQDGEARAAGEVEPQHQGIDEEADQTLGLQRPAARDWGADREVIARTSARGGPRSRREAT